MPQYLNRLQLWLRAHPVSADALTALLLACATVPTLYIQPGVEIGHVRRPDVLNAVLVLVAAGALALRRRYPVAVFVVVAAAELAVTSVHYPPSGDLLAFLIAVYTVAAHRGLGHSLPVGAVALIVLGVVILRLEAGVWNVLSDAFILGGIWWLGRSLRLRRAYLAELEARARRLEMARDADARAARTEERSRIARELHDVVAHHVSVMTVQAGAARRILERDPAGVRDALTTIEQMGRTALGEMRRMVGVLRKADEHPARSELSPQPGVHDVNRLVDHMRETGLQVQLWIEGEPVDLSPGVDLAAFRLIQEALTNTLKHAGPDARAWVRVQYGDHRLTVEVEDDGRGLLAELTQQNGTRGHGLVGMRERVALYGGDLRIGPRTGGGFEVRARFPLEV